VGGAGRGGEGGKRSEGGVGAGLGGEAPVFAKGIHILKFIYIHTYTYIYIYIYIHVHIYIKYI